MLVGKWKRQKEEKSPLLPKQNDTNKTNSADVRGWGQAAARLQAAVMDPRTQDARRTVPPPCACLGLSRARSTVCTGHPCTLGSAHLGLDLLGGVCEEDGRVGVAGAHLGLGPLEGGEEGRVQQGWFGVADPGGDVSCHPEVRILRGERGL